MDRTYNVDAAADALEEIASERIDNPFTKLHLAEITNVENWAHMYEPDHVGIPKAWRLIKQATNADRNARAPREELVLTVQGIITKKDLLPFEDKISPSSTHTQHLRQSVTLIGFQTPTFMRALENVGEIHALFGRSVGHQNLQTCRIISTHRQGQALEMSNRYFTPRKQAEQAEEFPLPHDIDPKDILKKAAGNRLVHIEDNIVQYYELVKTKGIRDTKFIQAKPIKFQVGDIVEAQVSVILIPQREGKFKSTMVLRSLTIMDGTFAQDVAKMQLQLQKSAMANMSVGPTLKCNVGYADEEFGITKHKLSRLRVEDDEDDMNKATQEWD